MLIHGGDPAASSLVLQGQGLARKATPVANVNVVYPLADTGFEYIRLTVVKKGPRVHAPPDRP